MSTDTSELELVFKHAGGVELRTPGNHPVIKWSSDDDPDFSGEFGTEIMSGDEDAEAVLEYLIDHDVLTDDNAGDVAIYDESLDGEDLEGPDDDDEDDEDEDADFE